MKWKTSAQDPEEQLPVWLVSAETGGMMVWYSTKQHHFVFTVRCIQYAGMILLICTSDLLLAHTTYYIVWKSESLMCVDASSWFINQNLKSFWWLPGPENLTVHSLPLQSFILYFLNGFTGAQSWKWIFVLIDLRLSIRQTNKTLPFGAVEESWILLKFILTSCHLSVWSHLTSASIPCCF